MAYELVGTPETKKVTQTLAIKYRDMDPVPQDRDLKPKRIEAYRKMLIAGMFRPAQWASAFCQETQGTYRVNGKHTSTLFAEYAELPQEVYVTTEHYHCDTLDDVAKLYATFDSKSQLRTTADINRAFAAVDEDLCELPSRLINLCVSALCFSRWGDKSDRSAADRAEVLLEDDCKKFILWCHAIVGSKNESTRHLWRTPVVAAMASCFFKCKRDAQEFWLAVRDGTGVTPKTPDRVLNRFLLSRGVAPNAGPSHRRSQATATTREMYVRCIHGWNAWRRDTTTDLKYHAQAKIPAAV